MNECVNDHTPYTSLLLARSSLFELRSAKRYASAPKFQQERKHIPALAAVLVTLFMHFGILLLLLGLKIFHAQVSDNMLTYTGLRCN